MSERAARVVLIVRAHVQLFLRQEQLDWDLYPKEECLRERQAVAKMLRRLRARGVRL